jgi:hypothetical protein
MTQMASVAFALFILAAATVAIALWWRRAADRSDKAFAAKLRRHGLVDFDRRLRGDVGRRLRPMDHLSLTRMMIEVLEQLDQAAPGPKQAAIVDPPDEGYRLACEELVALKRLARTANGVYVRAEMVPT